MQPTSLTNEGPMASMIDEALEDTDKYVSMVEMLSELVARKMPAETSELNIETLPDHIKQLLC